MLNLFKIFGTAIVLSVALVLAFGTATGDITWGPRVSAPTPPMDAERSAPTSLYDVNQSAKGDKAGGVTRVQKKAPTVVPPPPPPARNWGGMRYA